MVVKKGDYLKAQKEKSRKSCDLQDSCGERGIRTPGTSQCGSFQDCCNRPLYHLSEGGSTWAGLSAPGVWLFGCKGNLLFLYEQLFGT